MAKPPAAPPKRPASTKRNPGPPPRRPQMPTAEEAAAMERGNRAQMREAQDYRDFGKPDKKAKGGKVKKMAMGGKTRGCGAATKGTKYTRAG